MGGERTNYKKAFVVSIVVLAVFGTAFGILMAQGLTGFNIPVPASYTLTPSALFQITSLTFGGYNVTINQYANCQVIVLNTDPSSTHLATVALTLKTNTGLVVALGTIAGDVSASSSSTLTVAIAWNLGTNLGDVATGTIVVT